MNEEQNSIVEKNVRQQRYNQPAIIMYEEWKKEGGTRTATRGEPEHREEEGEMNKEQVYSNKQEENSSYKSRIT